jgi:hypothetical protein
MAKNILMCNSNDPKGCEKKWKKMSLLVHPDKSSGTVNEENALKVFRIIGQAKTIMVDDYLASLGHGGKRTKKNKSNNIRKKHRLSIRKKHRLSIRKKHRLSIRKKQRLSIRKKQRLSIRKKHRL